MSVVAMVWIDVRDGRGGVTVGTANKTNKERKKTNKRQTANKQTLVWMSARSGGNAARTYFFGRPNFLVSAAANLFATNKFPL